MHSGPRLFWRGLFVGPAPSAGSSRSHSVHLARIKRGALEISGTKNTEGPRQKVLPRDPGPIAGAIDQHISKVGLLNLARYEA
jgi:hypothetical protein